MKKFFIILLFFLCSAFAKAQAYIYHPMPDSNAVWNEENENTLGYPCSTYDYYSCFLGGDMVIGNYSYKKLFRWGAIDENCSPNLNYYQGMAFIRQDIPGKKVYVNLFGIDTLLYDFNMTIGDTISNSYTLNQGSGARVVSNIDSVLIGSTYRKKFKISGGEYDGYFIFEGIGSTIGLIPRFSSEFDWTYLRCFSINNQTVYPDTNSICDIMTEIKTDAHFSKINIQIYPSPASKICEISIDMQSASFGKIILYNSIGGNSKTIFFGKLDSGINIITYDTSRLSSGLYILQLVDEKDAYIINKLVEIIH